MRWLLMLTLCTACKFESPLVGADAAGSEPKKPDAATVAVDASGGGDASACDACVAAGGTCSEGTCEIDVATVGDITCPPGMPCKIHCKALAACDGHVDCSQATSCTIDCETTNTCNNAAFDCRGAGCTVYCRAANTCNGTTIDNHQSSCDLECCAINTCSNDFASPQTCSFGGSCPS